MDNNHFTAQCKSLSTKNDRCCNEEGHQGFHRSIRGTEWSILTKNDEKIDFVSNVRELVRSHAIFTKEYFDATQDLFQSLENIIQDQTVEVRRLSEEQIKPLADFLMQQSDVIGHPGDEGACAMAIRVIGELIDGD